MFIKICKKLSALDLYLSNNDFHNEINYLNEILKEAGVLKDTKKLYPELEDQIDYLVNGGVKPAHIGLVAGWIHATPTDPAEDFMPIVLRFYQINKNLDKKDLMQYSSSGELRVVVNEYDEQRDAKKTKRKESYHVESEEIEHINATTTLIYPPEGVTSKYRVYYPHSVESSCYYGGGTKWCTTGKIYANQFDNYAGKDVHLYYIHTMGDVDVKKNSMARMSIGLLNLEGEGVKEAGGSSMVDAENASITLEDIKKQLEGEGELIIQTIWNDAGSREKTSYNEIISNTTLEEYEEQVGLMQSRDVLTVSKNLAKNKHTQEEILNHFLQSEDPNLRAAMALRYMSNMGSTEEDSDEYRSLAQLMSDKSGLPQIAVAGSSNLNLEFAKLILESSPSFRDIEIGEQTAWTPADNALNSLARNSNIPDDYDLIRGLYLKLGGPLEANIEYVEEDDLELDELELDDVGLEYAANTAEKYWGKARGELIDNLFDYSAVRQRKEGMQPEEVSELEFKYLDLFLNDDSVEVKKELVNHIDKYPDILFKLAYDEDPIVRAKISDKNRLVNRKDLDIFSEHFFEEGRAISWSDALDIEKTFYLKLYNDHDISVVAPTLNKDKYIDSNAIEEAYSKWEGAKYFSKIQMYALQNKNMPFHLVKDIAEDLNSPAKESIFASYSIYGSTRYSSKESSWSNEHEELAEILLKYENPKVKSSILLSHSVPLETFITLLQEGYDNITESHNDILSRDERKILFEKSMSFVNHRDKNIKDKILKIQNSKKFAYNDHEQVRVALAKSEAASDTSNLILSKDDSLDVIDALIDKIGYKHSSYENDKSVPGGRRKVVSTEILENLLDKLLNNIDYFEKIHYPSWTKTHIKDYEKELSKRALTKEAARKKSKYPQAFREWLMRQLIAGKKGGLWQIDPELTPGAKMRITNSWLRDNEWEFARLKKEWDKLQQQSQEENIEPQRGDGIIDIKPGELHELADALEQSGGQIDLFS